MNSFRELSLVLGNDLETGDFDSLIVRMRPGFRQAMVEDDSVKAAIYGGYIAQSFLMLEQKDSFSHYLSLITPYVKRVEDPAFHCLYHNIYGGYYLKYMLNYSMALQHFKMGYTYAEKAENVNIMVAMLANIVYIFYIRSDKYGMEFAQRAEQLVNERAADGLARCQAFISMAQMHLLGGDWQKALEYVGMANELIHERNIYSLMPLACLVGAEVYTNYGNRTMADSCFRHAIQHLGNTEPDVASLVLLRYGIFCQKGKQIDKAIELCEEGLRISQQNGGIEFRRELLRTLADLHYMDLNVRDALWFYRQYLFHKDSIADHFVEHEFNKLLLDYQQLEYEHEVQSHKMSLLKANQWNVLLVAVVFALLVLFCFLYLWYRRKRAMYTTLVTQYQNYMQRTGKLGGAEGTEATEVEELAEKSQDDNSLFSQIEELMKIRHIYRQNNLSLESLADMVKSNRTYVSKAINVGAGMSFSAYINSYRIQEAVLRISDLENNVLMKQLADELGYNSLTVFSKAFQRETGCTPRQYRKTLVEMNKKDDDS